VHESGAATVVTDDQVAGLRAFLADDEAEWLRLFERPDPVDADEGFAVLVAAALQAAARRRWDERSTLADIVRFVAGLRSSDPDTEAEVDPRGAEALIRVALGDTAVGPLNDAAKRTQVHVLRRLIDDEQLDDAGLDEFLSQARVLADRISRSGGPAD
jgi:hypothetical protein